MIPYRLDVCGGWLDQPFVSRLSPGAVINVAIEDAGYAGKSGLSSSTRNTAIRLWGSELPRVAYSARARELYDAERGGAGSQDAIGIAIPGLKRSYYAGDEWPESISIIQADETLRWLESCLWIQQTKPRSETFNPLSSSRITADGARALAVASDETWSAICNQDVNAFGHAMSRGRLAQVSMFPAMMTPEIERAIAGVQCDGWKIAGAGGGGYLIMVSSRTIKGAQKIKVWRGDHETQPTSVDAAPHAGA